MSEDPRLTGAHVRRLPGTGDTDDVTLVGVVHDHPASVFRTRNVVADSDAAVLALELPPLALPLFVEYAADAGSPPVLGGEMSAAIQAADTERVVGIDGPSVAFTRRLVCRLVRERRSTATVRTVLGSLWAVTKHALGCRAGATLSRLTGLTVQADGRADHDCHPADDPRDQAEDEARQIRRAQTVMNVFQPDRASRLRQSTREAFMAERIGQLRSDGPVTAVVGIGHLESVAERVRAG